MITPINLVKNNSIYFKGSNIEMKPVSNPVSNSVQQSKTEDKVEISTKKNKKLPIVIGVILGTVVAIILRRTIKQQKIKNKEAKNELKKMIEKSQKKSPFVKELTDEELLAMSKETDAINAKLCGKEKSSSSSDDFAGFYDFYCGHDDYCDC